MKISDELRKWCDGADVDGNACDDLRVLADRIDREMMELPKDADGVPIRVGDVLYSSGNEFRVVNITVKANEVCVAVYADDGTFFPWMNPKYLSRKNIKPLESEVLDADGVPIEVGDTVYCDDYPEQLIVDSFDDPGCVYITLAKSPDGILYTIEPSRLSHECLDSWERIADELEGAEKWCDQNGNYDTGLVSITESKLREWSDRIRKLAKKTGGDAHGN